MSGKSWADLFEPPQCPPQPTSVEKNKTIDLCVDYLSNLKVHPALADLRWTDFYPADVDHFYRLLHVDLRGRDAIPEFVYDRVTFYYQWCVAKGFILDKEKGFGGTFDMQSGEIHFYDYIAEFIEKQKIASFAASGAIAERSEELETRFNQLTDAERWELIGLRLDALKTPGNDAESEHSEVDVHQDPGNVFDLLDSPKGADQDEIAESDQDEIAESDQDEIAESDQDEIAESDQDEIAESDQDEMAKPRVQYYYEIAESRVKDGIADLKLYDHYLEEYADPQNCDHPITTRPWETLYACHVEGIERLLSWPADMAIEVATDNLGIYYQWCVRRGFKVDKDKGFGGTLDMDTGEFVLDYYIMKFIRSVQDPQEIDNLTWRPLDKLETKLDIALEADYRVRIKSWPVLEEFRDQPWDDLVRNDVLRVKEMIGYFLEPSRRDFRNQLRYVWDYMSVRLPVYYRWCVARGYDQEQDKPFGCTVNLKNGEIRMYAHIEEFIINH
jgi:hypothetical protein